MSVTVGEVMRRCRHYFEDGETVYPLTEGRLPDALTGCWVAVTSPASLRGVYLAGEDMLPGTAEGTVTAHVLHPPAEFLRLCGDISRWTDEHPPTDIASEKYGGYSVSRTAARDWPAVFAQRLIPWQRMFTEVDA